jgi:putative oxidoreductase
MVQKLGGAGVVLQARQTYMKELTMAFCPKTAAVTGYSLLIRCASWLQSVVLLVFRLAYGWELFESGHGHLNNVAAMVKRFQDWGVPMPRLNVYVSGYTEMIGGILLMAGLGTRLISIPLLFNFCVAYLTASRDTVKGFFHNDPANFIDDTAFPFLVCSMLMITFGPGWISVDGLLKATVWRRKAAVKPSAAPPEPPPAPAT